MNSLIQLLISCETLLRSVGEKFWADKIKRTLDKGGESLDFYLLEEIISWYGGMGSLNDLIICEINGHLLKEKDEKTLNDEFNRVSSAIYEEAIRLTQD